MSNKARILAFDEPTNRISAVVTAFDYTDDISLLEKAKARIVNEGIEYGKCGINIKGQRHCDEDPCANATWDTEVDEEYCKVKRLDGLYFSHDKYKWLAPLSEYYWQNGIDKDGITFLKTARFVTSYEYVPSNKRILLCCR